MSTIVTRAVKGSALTHDEADANFNNLNTDKAELTDLASTATGEGASLIGIEDAGGIVTATTVEGAIQEIQAALDVEEAALAAHLVDAVDAHDASAISNVPAGNIAATTVQAAIDELDTEKVPESDFSAFGKTLVDDADSSALKTTIGLQVDGLTALQALTPGTEEVIYLTYRSTLGDGGGGTFIWNSSDLSTEVTADTQKGIYVPPASDATGASGAWVRITHGYVTPEMYGATGDGIADDTAELAGLFLTEQANITIGAGSYLISSTLTWSASDKVIRGVGPASEILMTADFRMMDFADNVSNVTFEDLKFRTTFTQSADQPFGLINGIEKNLTKIKFIRCTFTAPNAKANAAKFIAENAARMLDIEFIDCEFVDILRMGVEIQNHTASLSVTSLTQAAGVATANITGHGLSVGDAIQIEGATTTEWNGIYYVDTVPTVDSITFAVPSSFTTPATGTIIADVYRFENVRVLNSKFKNLPSIPAASYGMGVSLSGPGLHNQVDDNYFEDVYNPVEIVGSSNTSVQDNRAGDGCHILVSVTNVYPMYDNTIGNNKSIGILKGRGMQIENSIRAHIFGNRTETDNTYQTDGAVNFDGLTDCMIHDNIFKGRGSFGGYFTGACSGNKIHHNVFDNSLSASNNSTLRFDGASNTGNRIEFNQIVKGAGGAYWDETSGATGNDFFGNYRDSLMQQVSFTWDPASLVDGAGETSADISIPGVGFGDFLMVIPPYDLQGILCTAYLSAAETAKVRLQNETGGTIDLASGIWAIRAIKL